MAVNDPKIEEELEEVEELEELDGEEEEESLWEADDKSLKDVMTVFRSIRDPHVFAAPNFNRVKQEKAIQSYTRLGNDEVSEVLLHIDNTLFGGAKEGMIVTRNDIYFKELGGSPIRIEITADTTFSLRGKDLVIDGEKILPFRRPDASAMELVVKGLRLLAAKK